MQSKVNVNEVVNDNLVIKIKVVGSKKLRLRLWITEKLIWLIGVIGLPVEVEF